MPLRKEWDFFLDNGVWGEGDWSEQMKKLCRVGSVLDFWSYVNPMEESYHKICKRDKPIFTLRVFQKGVAPVFEDRANKHGGKWVISCKKLDFDKIWERWLEMLMCLVGEQYCRKDAVTGIVLAFRKQGRREIHVWVDTIPSDVERERKFLNTVLLAESVQFRCHDKGMAKVDKKHPWVSFPVESPGDSTSRRGESQDGKFDKPKSAQRASSEPSRSTSTSDSPPSSAGEDGKGFTAIPIALKPNVRRQARGSVDLAKKTDTQQAPAQVVESAPAAGNAQQNSSPTAGVPAPVSVANANGSGSPIEPVAEQPSEPLVPPGQMRAERHASIPTTTTTIISPNAPMTTVPSSEAMNPQFGPQKVERSRSAPTSNRGSVSSDPSRKFSIRICTPLMSSFVPVSEHSRNSFSVSPVHERPQPSTPPVLQLQPQQQQAESHHSPQLPPQMQPNQLQHLQQQQQQQQFVQKQQQPPQLHKHPKSYHPQHNPLVLHGFPQPPQQVVSGSPLLSPLTLSNGNFQQPVPAQHHLGPNKPMGHAQQRQQNQNTNTHIQPCHFGIKCTKPGCPFLHVVQPSVQTPCKFGAKCNRPNCFFAHPRAVQASAPSNSNSPSQQQQQQPSEDVSEKSLSASPHLITA